MDNTRKDTCTCKTCKENKGVACDVTNCYYHDGECHCTAEKNKCRTELCNLLHGYGLCYFQTEEYLSRVYL